MSDSSQKAMDIAVIGISCKFPGANSYQEYWDNLINGVNSISPISESRWNSKLFRGANGDPLPNWLGQIEGVDLFDNSFFNIAPREAKNMDPQQRLLLQEAWRCIEDSAMPLEDLQAKRTGTFVGVMTNDYHQYSSEFNRNIDSYAALGNYDCILANRLSYFLNLTGPSLSYDAACASSLVSVHEACLKLHSGELDYALAAGVNLCIHPWKHVAFAKSRMLSPDGQCKPFDVRANGYVPGEGIGVVLLQPLTEAIKNGAHIYGVIKGSAINHVGRSASITAPSIDAQKAVIERAINCSGVNKGAISYLEAHGTGTSLGDPIEVESLKRVFDSPKNSGEKRYIGSVKSNIGHLEGAAGIAGLIKVLLMMKHGQIPKLINLDEPNPLIRFEGSTLALADRNISWGGDGSPLIAGVSSFGFGGVNSHAVISSYECVSNEQNIKLESNFLLSAATESSLRSSLYEWTKYLKQTELNDNELASAVATLNASREQFDFRVAVPYKSKNDLIEGLEKADIGLSRKGMMKINAKFINRRTGVAGLLEIAGKDAVKFRKRQNRLLKKHSKTVTKTRRDGLDGLTETAIMKLALNKLAIDIDSVELTDGSYLTAFMVADVISYKQAASIVMTRSLDNISVRFPSTLLKGTQTFNDMLSKGLRKYSQSIKRLLADEMKIGTDSYFEYANSLNQYQFTFKKKLAEWEGLAKRHDISLLDNNGGTLSKQVSLIAIASALISISDKWEIGKTFLTSKVVIELATLIESRLVTKEHVIKWLKEENNISLVSVSDFNNVRLKSSDALNDLSLCFTKVVKKIIEKDITSAKVHSSGFCSISLELETFNSNGETLEEHWLFQKDKRFYKELCHLWLKGFNVNWASTYPEKIAKKAGLPTYRFEDKSHWLDGINSSKSSLEVVSSAENKALSFPEKAVSLLINESDVVRKAILESISEVASLKVEEIPLDKSLFELGIDSISQLDLIKSLEQQFGELQATLIYEYPNVSSLERFLLERGQYLGAEIKTFAEMKEISQSDAVSTSSIEDIVCNELAHLVQIEADQLDRNSSFFSMGVDSIMGQDFIAGLSKQFEGLPSTLLYEYPDINALVGYLKKANPVEVTNTYDGVGVVPQSEASSSRQAYIDSDDIAIIAMDGKFPKANNVETYWKNLELGTDCIINIPLDRWNSSEIDPSQFEEPNGSYGKWGGFIEGVDLFDPLFFGISPIEAEQMDPQQRLFLESCWNTLDQAGYAKLNSRNSERIGLYVGVMWNEYSTVASKYAGKSGRYSGPGSIYWAIANRASYFLNLTGPSIAIDTACSSSLIALHQACMSIRNGECEMAIAGGVNLSFDPAKYTYLSQAKFLSTEGKCRSFGEGGDGYVPGEGVVSLLLKPAKKAIADNDYIYGVVKASSINHGGKATGFTVPNPEAQSKIVAESLSKAKLTPDDIDYIECHGTGTALGDPIEIAGLSKIFNDSSRKWPIGSVKSNIGHLEAAAGIAALIKVLLSFKNDLIPKSLHSTVKNRKIDFNNSSFKVVDENVAWSKPKTQQRHATVSSFGAGGANASAIVSSYRNEPHKNEAGRELGDVFLFTAKTEHSLKAYIKDLSNRLKNDEFSSNDFHHVAYTLRERKEHFNFRLGVFATSLSDLSLKLDSYVRGDEQPNQVTIGKVNRKLASTIQDVSFSLFTNVDYAYQALSYWVEGRQMNWDYGSLEDSLKIVHLPSYSFDRKSYWLGEFKSSEENLKMSLPDEFSIDSACPRFQDHIVHNKPLLPGVVCIDLISHYIQINQLSNVACLRDIRWLRPIYPGDQSTRLRIKSSIDSRSIRVQRLFQDEDDQLCCQVEYVDDIDVGNNVPRIDWRQLKASMGKQLNKFECYKAFNKLGFVYGSSFQPINEWYGSENEAISMLSPTIDKNLYKSTDPSLLDGALQSCLLLLNQKYTYLPFSISEYFSYQKLEGDVVVYVKKVDESNALVKFDIVVTNLSGNLLVEFKGFSLRNLGINNYKTSDDQQTLKYFGERWHKSMPEKNDAKPSVLILFADGTSDLGERLSDKFDKVIVIHAGNQYEAMGNNQFLINPDDPDNYRRLFRDLLLNDIGTIGVLYAWQLNKQVNENKPSYVSLKADAVCGKHFLFIAQALNDTNHRNAKLINIYQNNSGVIRPGRSAAAGLAKTIAKEGSKLSIKTIELSGAGIEPNENDILDTIDNEFSYSWDHIDIKYSDGIRYQNKLIELESRNVESNHQLDFKGKTLLITGGLGGLGKLFARHFVERFDANVILVGRRHISESETKLLEREYSGAVSYVSADLSKLDELDSVFEIAREKDLKIQGVLHSAGVLRDSSHKLKTKEQWEQVCAPKIDGSINLLTLASKYEVDFVALFSSISSLVGNPGQSDYAFANAFMDNLASFAEMTNEKTKVVSINWPLWKDGGMQVSPQIAKFIESTMGIEVLETVDGIRVLESILVGNETRVMPGKGWLKGAISSSEKFSKYTENQSEPALVPITQAIAEEIESFVSDAVSELVGVSVDGIDSDEPIVNYGFDSVSFGALADKISAKYGIEVTPAAFYEVTTVDEIATYVLELSPNKSSENPAQADPIRAINSYNEKVVNYVKSQVAKICGVDLPLIDLDTSFSDYGFDSITFTQLAETISSNFDIDITADRFYEFGSIEDLIEYIESCATPKDSNLAIPDSDDLKNDENREQEAANKYAIVGMDCKLPGANSVEQFWENLVNGVDSITSVPKDRLDLQETKINWGGFIDDIDMFDAEFFGVSPREAELMDPQQRHVLQCCWRALEDAGIVIDRKSSHNIGVFVGAANQDYEELLLRSGVPIEPHTPTGNSLSIISNRVSYLFNFTGPSETVDTACSSSLVALNRAINSIASGECEIALVGGVNALLSTTNYIAFDKAGMLSPDGKCKTFDNAANGYVRGEGVGVVVVKPLADALKSNDRIYALVDSVVVNHGGRANSLTAPNPNAQASLIGKAYTSADIKLSNVKYIESHGTGTALGDPIEINGLKKAFHELSDGETIENNTIAVGALKTNIGHLETAAGIAGLIKLALCLYNNKLVPNINLTQQNEFINIKDSPFYFPVGLQEIDSVEGPVIGGVSSFGYGGVNAHAVLESFTRSVRLDSADANNYLFVFSAPNESGLNRLVRQFIEFLDGNDELMLPSIAYTLQLCRYHHAKRLAIRAFSKNDLKEKLKSFMRGVLMPEVYKPSNSYKPSEVRNILTDMQPNDLGEIAKFWVEGGVVAWNKLYPNGGSKVSIPLYPFLKDRYWYTLEGNVNVDNDFKITNAGDDRFEITLNSSEEYIIDHKVHGHHVVPGMTYILIAKQIVNQYLGAKFYGLQNISWITPVSFSGLKKLYVRTDKSADSIAVEFVDPDSGRLVMSADVAQKYELNETPVDSDLDRSSLEGFCPVENYRAFEDKGLNYGGSFRLVREIHLNSSFVSSKIKADNVNVEDLISTQLLDSMMHGINSLLEKNETTGLYIPFSLKRFSLFKTPFVGSELQVIAKSNSKVTADIESFDVWLLDKKQVVLCAFEGLWLKEIGQNAVSSSHQEHINVLVPEWV